MAQKQIQPILRTAWSALYAAGVWLVSELTKVAIATFNQVSRFVALTGAEGRLWFAKRHALSAKELLGEQLAAKGIGDRTMLDELSSLNASIADDTASRFMRWRHSRSKRRLLRALSEQWISANESSELGAGVVSAGDSAERASKRAAELRSKVRPKDFPETARVAVGAALTLFVLYLVPGILFAPSGSVVSANTSHTQVDGDASRVSPSARRPAHSSPTAGEAPAFADVPGGITKVEHDAIVTAVRDLALSADGKRLVVGKPRELLVHDTTTGELTHSFPGPTAGGDIVCVGLSDDGRFAVAGIKESVHPLSDAEHGSCHVFDLAAGKRIVTIKGIIGAVSGVALSPDGALLAVTQELRDLEHLPSTSIYGLPTGRRLWSIQSPVSGSLRLWEYGDVQFTEDGRNVLVATNQSRDGKHLVAAIQLRDSSTGDLIRQLEYPQSNEDRNRVVAFDLSANADVVIGCGTNREVHVWNDTLLKHTLSMEHDINDVALVAGSNIAVLACEGGNTHLIDIQSGKIVDGIQGEREFGRLASASNAAFICASAKKIYSGQVFFWSPPFDEPMAWLVSSGNAWTIVTSHGYVDGTEESFDTLICEKDGRWQSARDFRSIIHRPDVVQHVLGQR